MHDSESSRSLRGTQSGTRKARGSSFSETSTPFVQQLDNRKVEDLVSLGEIRMETLETEIMWEQKPPNALRRHL